MPNRNKYAAFILVICFFSAQCSENLPEETLLIAAASNLQYAFSELEEKFEKKTGIDVIFVWGATGNLAIQLENGAPYDLFFAGGKEYLQNFLQKDKITAVPIMNGSITLGIKQNTDFEINSLGDITSDSISRISIASVTHAPFGKAAKEALQNAGVWEQIIEKVIQTESARHLLQLLKNGNTDVAIIPSHFPKETGLKYLEIDPALYTAPEIIACLVKDSKMRQNAQKFIDFLESDINRNILLKYNYTLK